jgi:DHA1 family bicyclomycin/chloramphenicol resistance-like MFS transporter
MKDTKRKKNFYLILILGMLTAIGPFSIDMYLPAFPDIAKNLHTTVAQVTLSLSSFFIGISVGQLLYGPLLERFGRKKTFIYWTLHLSACFYWLCPGSISKCINISSTFAGIRWLRGYGGSKSNGA